MFFDSLFEGFKAEIGFVFSLILFPNFYFSFSLQFLVGKKLLYLYDFLMLFIDSMDSKNLFCSQKRRIWCLFERLSYFSFSGKLQVVKLSSSVVSIQVELQGRLSLYVGVVHIWCQIILRSLTSKIDAISKFFNL